MLDPNFLTLNTRGTNVQDFQASHDVLNYTIPRHELDEQVFGILSTCLERKRFKHGTG